MVSIPCFTLSYDCILDNGSQLLKVQIKSSRYKAKDGRYRVGLKRGKGGNYKTYESNQVDIFAVYLVPEDMWYFLPQDHVSDILNISINVDSKEGYYQAFKDNWDIFKRLL